MEQNFSLKNLIQVFKEDFWIEMEYAKKESLRNLIDEHKTMEKGLQYI